MDKQVHHYTITLPIDQAERLHYRARQAKRKPGPMIVELLDGPLSKGRRLEIPEKKKPGVRKGGKV